MSEWKLQASLSNLCDGLLDRHATMASSMLYLKCILLYSVDLRLVREQHLSAAEQYLSYDVGSCQRKSSVYVLFNRERGMGYSEASRRRQRS